MKNIFCIALFISIIAGGLHSCRKGENDPAISLLSRKMRIAGKWNVVSSNSSGNQTSDWLSVSFNSTYSNGTLTHIMTIIENGNVTSDTSIQSFTATFDIRKNGTYTIIRTLGDQQSTQKGTWTFLKQSKKDGLKNKEAIMFTTTEISSTGGQSMNQTLNGKVYSIDMLKNKEMVWKAETTSGEGLNYNREELSFEQN
jgi:hypothetical protein